MASTKASSEQLPAFAEETDLNSGQQLPALKEIVGKEFRAERPILPQPPPAQVPSFFIPGVSVLYIDDLPIRTYRIGASIYNMAQPQNETLSEHSRFTVDGRRISYRLEVVQQPEKARACGSGPRSSADRRPVDPPPVVELTVFEHDKDITFQYESNFMLYASLEVARPIAAGKMHTPAAIPVLTGVAVASAAYLERPKRAAYFIFPDLSVRHEGWYRLKFSLFESMKHDADADQDRPFARTQGDHETMSRPVRHESMFNRLEVQSVPFQVYSAKKFPGLNSSTQLSVMVAEQGCRVRIRRDIRQRKRRQKAGPEIEDGHNNSYQGTPQATYRQMEHQRSASRNSLGSQFEGEMVRRASVESLYGRPVLPSRQPSAANASLPSPTLPSPTTSMPPPPMTHIQPPMSRPSYDYFPRPPPAQPHTAYPPSAAMALPSLSSVTSPRTPDTDGKFNLTLPAPNYNPGGAPRYEPMPLRDPVTGLYKLQEPSAAKRSFSSHGYDQPTALKAGARPDMRPAYPMVAAPLAFASDSYIEPDVVGQDQENDDLLEGDLIYTRADGSRAFKAHQRPSYRR